MFRVLQKDCRFNLSCLFWYCGGKGISELSQATLTNFCFLYITHLFPSLRQISAFDFKMNWHQHSLIRKLLSSSSTFSFLGISSLDCIRVGFLPRNFAKWVSPLWDEGFFSFSGYVYPKEVLAAALGGNNKRVSLILHVFRSCCRLLSDMN